MLEEMLGGRRESRGRDQVTSHFDSFVGEVACYRTTVENICSGVGAGCVTEQSPDPVAYLRQELAATVAIWTASLLPSNKDCFRFWDYENDLVRVIKLQFSG